MKPTSSVGQVSNQRISAAWLSIAAFLAGKTGAEVLATATHADDSAVGAASAGGAVACTLPDGNHGENVK